MIKAVFYLWFGQGLMFPLIPLGAFIGFCGTLWKNRRQMHAQNYIDKSAVAVSSAAWAAILGFLPVVLSAAVFFLPFYGAYTWIRWKAKQEAEIEAVIERVSEAAEAELPPEVRWSVARKAAGIAVTP